MHLPSENCGVMAKSMDRVFRSRKDWFEVAIVPAIRRRTIIGAVLIGLCAVVWLYWDSWIPIVVAGVIVAERVYEFAHIPKTKEIIDSLNIQIADNGLVFYGANISGSVVYPWASLAYKVVRDSSGEPEEILVEDRDRKNSKLKLVGYEGISELVALIESNATKP